MMTVEHLLQICQGGGGGGGGRAGSGIGHGGSVGGGPELHHSEPPPALDEAAADPSQRIQQVPFNLDLIHLLPMCQQAELLVSTFVQGEGALGDFYFLSLLHSLALPTLPFSAPSLVTSLSSPITLVKY